MENSPTLEIEALMPDQVEKKEVFSYQEAKPAEQEAIGGLLMRLDIRDAHSIKSFGANAQKQLTIVSKRIHEAVQIKNIGPVSQALTEIAAVMRGFDLQGLDSYMSPGFFPRLLGVKAKPVVKFISQYYDVSKQLNQITDSLVEHNTSLVKGIVSLDHLYDASLGFLHDLELHISAGSERLRQLDKEDTPETQLKEHDLRDSWDNLNQRIHDLRLAHQVGMRSMPSLHMAQENDKALVAKVASINDAILLWRQELSQAVFTYRSGSVASKIKTMMDPTNGPRVKHVDVFKNTNGEVRSQVAKGIVDVESLKETNDILIATIEESLQLAEQGKQNQQQTLSQLQSAVEELHVVQKVAKGRSQGVVRDDTVEINIQN